jgi:hypothetical protein
MTVATIAPLITYLENGATTLFNVPFQFIDKADLVVTSIDATTGAETVLALDAAYSVTGGDGDTGDVLRAVAGTAGDTLRIERRTPRAQGLDYQPNGEFPAESHERGLDRAMMIDQEQDARIMDPDAIRALIATLLHPGSGISIVYDPDAKLITISNLFDAEFVRDTIAATLKGGPGVSIDPDDALDEIHISVPALTELAGCVKLSGDAGGGTGLGGVAGPTGEQIQDLIAAMLVEGAGIDLVYNDVAGTLTITNTSNYTDEQARDAIGAALQPGVSGRISITPDDAGDHIVIDTDALGPTYAGIVPIGEAGAFNFADTMCGSGILYTGGAAAATLRAQVTHALRSGWAVTVYNDGTGPLSILRAIGVTLRVNGAGGSADATIAQGGWAQIWRIAADKFAIAGPGVS